MRRPRDYDTELKALDAKVNELKERKLRQFGVLVIATGADTLPVEELVGTLLLTVGGEGPPKDECQRRGERFFRRSARGAAKRGDRGASGGAADAGSAQPAAGEAGAA
jgi:DNA-binding protein H-NS